MIITLFLWAQILAATASTSTQTALEWTEAEPARLLDVDDDIRRNAQQVNFLDNIEIREVRFSENGFDWHLFRFERADRKTGPLWLVPHDDENAAFDAMITALKEHGGVGVAVNSGPDSMRMQTGSGLCGVRYGVRSSCDPNRNFDAQSPRYTAAILDQRPVDQPIIALHTNSPGFAGDGHGGRGDITIIDQAAFRRGITSPREGALFAVSPSETMANFDTLGLTAYQAQEGAPSPSARECGQKIANAGVHFWHERVVKSDGSMSNYLVLNRPDIPYFNAESRAEIDLAIAAARHKVMIEAYLANCASGNQPAP